MTNSRFSNIIIFLLIVLLSFIILNPSFVVIETSHALSVFITKYFPAVFLIYIITDLLINYHFPDELAKKCQNLCRWALHSSGNCAFVIIMSMISGFPSGAKYIRELLEQKVITDEEANYLISFTHFSNPLFILGTCFLITKDRTLTIFILLCHFLANFVIAVIVRPKEAPKIERKRTIEESSSFTTALTASIYKTFRLMFLILGTSLIFFVLSGILTSFIPISPYHYLLTGILDLTKGITMIPAELAPLGKGVIILLFLSFGSFSIHMQVLSIIKDTNVCYRNFLLGRISQVAISILLFCICHVLSFI